MICENTELSETFIDGKTGKCVPQSSQRIIAVEATGLSLSVLLPFREAEMLPRYSLHGEGMREKQII